MASRPSKAEQTDYSQFGVVSVKGKSPVLAPNGSEPNSGAISKTQMCFLGSSADPTFLFRDDRRGRAPTCLFRPIGLLVTACGNCAIISNFSFSNWIGRCLESPIKLSSLLRRWPRPELGPNLMAETPSGRPDGFGHPEVRTIVADS